jgi:hypothetical protein
MRRQELEKLLRKAEPLRQIEVVHESAFREAMAPNLVMVRGTVSLYGEIRAFETEVNLKEFRSELDVYRLAKALLSSFEEAAKEVAKEKH